jgi:hypothetical protein
LTGHHQAPEEDLIAAALLHTTTGLLHRRRLVTSRIGAMAETTIEAHLMTVHDTAYLLHQAKAGILCLDHLATDLEIIGQTGETVEPLLSTHMSQPTMPVDQQLAMTGDHGTQMTVLEKVGVALAILANPETNMKMIALTEADRTEKEMRGPLGRADEMGEQDHEALSDVIGTAIVIGTMSIGGRWSCDVDISLCYSFRIRR